MKPHNLTCLTLALLLALPQARAASPIDGNEVARAALKSVVTSQVSDFVKAEINKHVFTTFGAVQPTVPGAPAVNGAGNTIMGGIDIGLAVIDFTKAENDKGRTYAGARAVSGALTIAFPPAGAIASIGVMVVSLTESLLAAASQEEMLRIRKRIDEHRQAIMNILASFSKADRAALGATHEMIEQAESALKIMSQETLDKCTDPAKINTADIFGTCINSVVGSVNAIKALIRLNQSLIYFPMIALDREAYFADGGHSVSEYQAKIDKLSAQLAPIEVKLNEFLSMFTRLLVKEAIASAERDGLPSPREDFVRECSNQSLDLLRSGALLKHYGNKLPASLATVVGQLNEGAFLDQVEMFNALPCAEYLDSRITVQRMVLDNMSELAKLQKTLRHR